jgi:hypothetical protein
MLARPVSLSHEIYSENENEKCKLERDKTKLKHNRLFAYTPEKRVRRKEGKFCACSRLMDNKKREKMLEEGGGGEKSKHSYLSTTLHKMQNEK